MRRLAGVFDLGLRTELAPYYSHTGWPSVDPELMIRMMLLGYFYSVRSDRRLCQDVDMSFACSRSGFVRQPGNPVHSGIVDPAKPSHQIGT